MAQSAKDINKTKSYSIDFFLKWNNSDYPLEEFYIFDFDFEIFNGCSYHNLALASM
jgi:hypothetical protein